ncbi:MAG: restriction endonuclease subunit S, partial [Bacteroidales bacterium]
LLPIGTTIISARGTVGKCAIVGEPMAMNQSCYGVRGASGYRDYYIYYTILLRVADLQQRGHGSVFNTITRDTFRSIKTVACPSELSNSFDKAVQEFLDKIVANLRQIDSLAALRDTLLPKLLSGQLRIPDAEKQVAEAL